MTWTCPRILIVTPPGSTVAMRVRELARMLPPPGPAYAAACATVGLEPSTHPFRAPHFTISSAGMVGNARYPGEVSLATDGILFLDQLTDFRRSVIQDMIRAVNSHGRVQWPMRPKAIIAAVMPCPCGHLGDSKWPCKCPAQAVGAWVWRSFEYAKILGATVVHVPGPTSGADYGHSPYTREILTP